MTYNMHNRGATTLLSAIHVSMSSIEEHAFTRLAGMFFPRSSIKIANGAFHLPYRKQTRSKKDEGWKLPLSSLLRGCGEGRKQRIAEQIENWWRLKRVDKKQNNLLDNKFLVLGPLSRSRPSRLTKLRTSMAVLLICNELAYQTSAVLPQATTSKPQWRDFSTKLYRVYSNQKEISMKYVLRIQRVRKTTLKQKECMEWWYLLQDLGYLNCHALFLYCFCPTVVKSRTNNLFKY